MTDPTGRSFLSYKRFRRDEAALLIQAQHDHGIPTWQDVHNLASVPTEDSLRQVLADPSTASAILFITPEVENSTVIREVEVPKIVQRAETRDGFFAVPIAAGGLDFVKAAEATSNHLSAQNLADWNMHKVPAAAVSPNHAADVANRVLIQRIEAIHRHFPQGIPLRIGLLCAVRLHSNPARRSLWTGLPASPRRKPLRRPGATRFFPHLNGSPRLSASMRRTVRSKRSGFRLFRPPRPWAAPSSRLAGYNFPGVKLHRDATINCGRLRSRERSLALRRRS